MSGSTSVSLRRANIASCLLRPARLGNIASQERGNPAAHFSRCVGGAVPDGFALAVFVPCAFDLVGGGGGAPEEAFGEAGLLDDGVGHGAGNLRVWDRGAVSSIAD